MGEAAMKITDAEHFCEARTWRQDRDATWGGSQFGCQRAAVTQVAGHWACTQHAKNPPKNGWN
jgi:hypothetical protein